MKKKHYYLLRSISLGIVSLVFFSLSCWDANTDNLYSKIGFIAIGLVTGFFAYKLFQKRNEEGIIEQNYMPPPDATTEQQIAFYKKYIYLSLIAFPLLTYIVIQDLTDLEAGAESVRVWAPIAFIYENYGYSPAIYATPILGIVVIVGFLYKIRSIKNLSTSKDKD